MVLRRAQGDLMSQCAHPQPNPAKLTIKQYNPSVHLISMFCCISFSKKPRYTYQVGTRAEKWAEKQERRQHQESALHHSLLHPRQSPKKAIMKIKRRRACISWHQLITDQAFEREPYVGQTEASGTLRVAVQQLKGTARSYQGRLGGTCRIESFGG